MTVQALKEQAGLATNGSETNALVKHEDWLIKFQPEIRRALPSHMTADRMSRIALTELRLRKELRECDPRSFFGAVIQASQLGLEPGSGLGHCYLVPYRNKNTGKKECQFQLGYRGMIDLARRSGNIISISSHVVHANDHFDYAYGLEPVCVHRPLLDGDRGPMIYVYAVAILKDGGKQFEVMSKADVDAIRRRSMAANSGPWVTDYLEMARKTAIRRLYKYLPTSVEMRRAEALDNAADAGESQFNDLILTGEAPPPADDDEIIEVPGAAALTEEEKFELNAGSK